LPRAGYKTQGMSKKGRYGAVIKTGKPRDQGGGKVV